MCEGDKKLCKMKKWRQRKVHSQDRRSTIHAPSLSLFLLLDSLLKTFPYFESGAGALSSVQIDSTFV